MRRIYPVGHPRAYPNATQQTKITSHCKTCNCDQLSPRNPEDWNMPYIFSATLPNEKRNWHRIFIVKKDYWDKNSRIDDRHITDEIWLPDGFYEESESTFSYSPRASRGDVIGMLGIYGFQHSIELQEWMKTRT